LLEQATDLFVEKDEREIVAVRESRIGAFKTIGHQMEAWAVADASGKTRNQSVADGLAKAPA